MDSKALFKLTNGMYVIGSRKGDKLNGQIADVVFQVTSEPITIAASIAKQNLTHEYISASKVFSVSILSEEATMQYIGHFGFRSGREIDKFKDVKYRIGKTGAPIALEYAIAVMEAKVIDQAEVGDHTVFIAEVVDAEITSDKEPMTYAYYHKVKKGLTPKAAPTYYAASEVKEAPVTSKKEGTAMQKYRCTVCGYIYDPQKGDPDSGVAPDTQFEKLPDTWVCPVCGADKSAFEPVNE